MADNTIKVRLQSAYKSSADWDTLNPVLKNGEVGYVSSPASMYGWYKIGNGTSTWKQLPYSTYRPLNNGDFDTINVTDETAGDLIVTGAARFLNTIQGTAASAVNAGTASSASNAAKTTGTLTIKEALGAPSTPSVTFNGSANVTATITVPSHTSHLTNNSGYITSGATVAEAKKTSGTLTITQNGTSKGTFNGSANTTVALTDTVYTHPTDGKAGTFGSSTNQTPAFGGNAIVPWFTTNSAGHVTSAGTANLKIPSTSGLATTAYVNERVANAVHFKGGFDPSNADALKTPVKEIGDMYVATTIGTFYGLALEVGDSIIFQFTVAAGANPTSSDFIGVEKTVSVTNNNPTLAWNTVSTVGTVEGVALTVKAMAKPTYTYSDVGAAPASHNHSQIITIGDQRATATKPYDYKNDFRFMGLKNNSAINSPSTDSYSYLIGLRGWSDSSGGNSHEIAFNNSGIYVRQGATTAWDSWAKIYTTLNKPTSSDLGLGTMAFKSSADYSGTGHKHDDLYLPATNVDNSLKIESKVLKHKTTLTATANISGNTSTTMSFGGSFAVPYFSIDAYGHATAVGQKTFTLPGNPNVDTKVTQTATTAKTYLIGNAGSATTTSGANLSTAVYMNNGNLVVGGSITIGGNNADTSGAKWQYNSSLESVSLVFA